MYRKLTAHNSECDEIFFQVQDCDRENPYLKFLAYCEPLDIDLKRCLRELRKKKWRANNELTKERLQRMRSGVNTDSSTN